MVIPIDIAVNLPAKIVKRDSCPRAAIEHFVFEPSKETFAGCVIGGAALLRHRANETSPIHPFNPSGPSIMAAPVRMDNRMTALWQIGNHLIQHGVDALGRVPIVQPTTIPSKQSIMAERYSLPFERANSVISVSNFSYG